MPDKVFSEKNFISLCDALIKKDKHLLNIVHIHGYPPLWNRTATFSTLIHIILEQQVSLASAKAAFLKLQEKIGAIEPEKILLLDDEEMKASYFSRQKMKYARHLAEAILNKHLIIDELTNMNDDEVRIQLKKIKGIGDWTVDIFLMVALHRCDCFATGDIALMKSIKEVKNLPENISKEKITAIAARWKPYRTIAAYLLWHAYIKKRNIQI